MRVLALLPAALVLAGCGAHVRSLAPVRSALILEDPQAALRAFEASKPKEGDLLAALERAHLLRLAGDFRQSNLFFERAERLAEDLYTRSVSRHLAALITSDKTLPYRGTFYETALVPFYRALNYLDLGEPAEALVEARKAGHFLSLTGTEKRDDEDALRVRAFLAAFAGLVFASEGEWNDAAVSLRRAYRLYARAGERFAVPMPPFVPEEYRAAALRLGLAGEAREVERAHPRLAGKPLPPPRAVVVAEHGFVPHKVPVTLAVPVLKFRERGDSDEAAARRAAAELSASLFAYEAHRVELSHVLTFAFPKLRSFPSLVRGVHASVPGGGEEDAPSALDLARTAEEDFRNALPAALFRTLLRVFAKDRARVAAKKEDSLLGFAVNLLNVTTEQADTRSWLTLPGHVAVAVVPAPPEARSATVRFFTPFSGWEEAREVELKGGGEIRWGITRSYL